MVVRRLKKTINDAIELNKYKPLIHKKFKLDD